MRVASYAYLISNVIYIAQTQSLKAGGHYDDIIRPRSTCAVLGYIGLFVTYCILDRILHDMYDLRFN